MDRKYYWIALSEWSLKALFIDECISPVSWYNQRGFGNKSIRNEVIDDAYDYILLHQGRPLSDYSLKVRRELIEPSKIKMPTVKGGPFGYQASIHIIRGLVEIYFSSRDLKTSFLRRSRMILELKPLTKWEHSMIVESFEISSTKTTLKAQFDMSFTNNNELMSLSRGLNSLKGGFICLAYGITLFEAQSTTTLKRIRELKNHTVGLHTSISLHNPSEDSSLDNLINEWGVQINSFKSLLSDEFQRLSNILSTRFNSVQVLFAELTNALKNSNDNNSDDLFKLREHREQLESELNSIKDEEKANGEKVGKSRVYFKKGSERYERKIAIKESLKSIKQEYLDLIVHSHRNIEMKLNSAIDEQFWAISSAISEIETKLSQNQISFFESIKSCVSRLDIEANADRVLILSAKSLLQAIDYSNDSELLVIILKGLRNYQRGWTGDKSNETLLKVIEFVGSRLEVKEDKDCLRIFFRFKRGDSARFDYSENILLNSFFAFILKPYDFQSLSKYCQGKDQLDERLSFLFFGLFNGFSALPSSLVAKVNEHDNQFYLSERIDKNIYELHMNMLKES